MQAKRFGTGGDVGYTYGGQNQINKQRTRFGSKFGYKLNVPNENLNKYVGKKKGGAVKHSDMSKDKPMMEKVAKKAVKGHEKAMHGMKKGGMTCGPATKKMAKGGVTRADGCVTKGHTKGKMIAMRMGGKTCG